MAARSRSRPSFSRLSPVETCVRWYRRLFQSGLCPKCKIIPLDEVFSMWKTSTSARVLRKFGLPESGLQSDSADVDWAKFGLDPTCSFCCAVQLLFLVNGFVRTWPAMYMLVAAPSRLVYAESFENPHIPEGLNATLLGVVMVDELEYLTPRPPPLGGLIVNGFLAEYRFDQKHFPGLAAIPVPVTVDFEAISKWIRFCLSEHETCNGGSPLVQHLRVIDCETRGIILAPKECAYVALSYVWGQSNTTCNSTFKRLPFPAPRTIEDAIFATKKLDLRYLWIDRYCIPQNQHNEKHHQIQNMHHIYRGAQVTIIAAAGHGPDHGLPGVSIPRQDFQNRFQFRSKLLLQTPPHPGHDISTSAWASRGWTFQEGFLATRRLVFTEREVFFQCGLADWREATPSRFYALPQESASWHAYIPKALDYNYLRLEHVWNWIHEYSKRTLSTSGDALNAMLGILEHSCENVKGPYEMRHLWGVPLVAQRHLPRLEYWNASLTNALFWRLEEPGQRREGFPSWSWTGWIGVVRGSPNYPIVDTASFSVELSDGSLEDLNDFGDMFQLRPCITQFLHFDATFVKLELMELVAVGKNHEMHFRYPKRNGFDGSLNASNFFSKLTSVYPEGKTRSQIDENGSKFAALVFHERRILSAVMVIREVVSAEPEEDSWWERVAVGELYIPEDQWVDVESEVKHIRLG